MRILKSNYHPTSSINNDERDATGPKVIWAKMLEKTTLLPGETRHIKVFPSTDVLVKTLIFKSNEYLKSLDVVTHPQAVDGTLDHMDGYF